MTADAVRDRILRGVYPEGSPLRQDAIAEELAVSRIPVREALRQLEAEGLVTVQPHRGATVSSLSPAEIDELFDLRASIEPNLLRLAVPRLDSDEYERAEAVLAASESALDKGDVSHWGELNWQFHSTLYAAAGRQVTLDLVRKLHQQTERYSRMQLALTHAGAKTSTEHRQILGAVKRRDVKRATAILRRHILGGRNRLVSFLRDEKARANSAPTRSRRGRA
jgi:DNA-binding GntR family transcriptional regulator